MTSLQPNNAPAAPLNVALDVSPLLGPLTGIGAAVRQMVIALGEQPDVALTPYACSFRGKLQPGTTRLPLPAAVAQRMWARLPGPRVDRWLEPAQVVHGTNYVVPPSRLPRVVTVYDCWFLRNAADASPDVTRAGQVLRRAVASGAMVHTSSEATANAVRDLLNTDRVEAIPLAPLPLDVFDVEPHAPVAELVGVPYVLALGTLERRKNLPRLVAAFGQIASAHPDLRLALAGTDGDDRGAINTAIDALNASARARVLSLPRSHAPYTHPLSRRAALLVATWIRRVAGAGGGFGGGVGEELHAGAEVAWRERWRKGRRKGGKEGERVGGARQRGRAARRSTAAPTAALPLPASAMAGRGVARGVRGQAAKF